MKTLCQSNKNCDGRCCRNLLLGTIAEWEARVIAIYVEGSPDVQKRLAELKPIKEAEYENWKKKIEKQTYLKIAFRCPFHDNETNKCLVYIVRPVMCRIYYVNKNSHCPYGFEDIMKNPALAGSDSDVIWRQEEGFKYFQDLFGKKSKSALDMVKLLHDMNKKRTTLMMVSRKLNFFGKNIVIPKNHPVLQNREDIDCIEGDYYPVV
jgi:Fe-S-cluster containining protein